MVVIYGGKEVNEGCFKCSVVNYNDMRSLWCETVCIKNGDMLRNTTSYKLFQAVYISWGSHRQANALQHYVMD